MDSQNIVVVSGRLTQNPVVRDLNGDGDRKVTELSIALNRTYPTSDGKWKDAEPTYVDISVFAGLGKLAAQKLAKADRISASGRLEQSRWTDGDGNQHSKLRIVANHIEAEAFFTLGAVEEDAA